MIYIQLTLQIFGFLHQHWVGNIPGKKNLESFKKQHLNLLYDGTGTPLQYSCLENPMYRGAWQAAVRGVAQSWTRLSNFTFTFHFHAMEKGMATHSSVLAWRIQGWRSLVGYRLWGRTESDTTEVTQHSIAQHGKYSLSVNQIFKQSAVGHMIPAGIEVCIVKNIVIHQVLFHQNFCNYIICILLPIHHYCSSKYLYFIINKRMWEKINADCIYWQEFILTIVEYIV